MSPCLLDVEHLDDVANATVTDNCHVVSFHLIELGLLLGLPTGLTARCTTPGSYGSFTRLRRLAFQCS